MPPSGLEPSPSVGSPWRPYRLTPFARLKIRAETQAASRGILGLSLDLCYTQIMSDTLTLRVPGREKEAWQKLAESVGEELSEFARKAVRQRVQAVQAKLGSPWDDLLGTVSTDAPPATNQNVRKAMRRGRP